MSLTFIFILLLFPVCTHVAQFPVQVMIGEDKLLKFSGVPLGEACTIVLRGATQQILDEAERSIHDALCVLQQTVKETRIVYGGGE
jgi:T-complex protein 1 subunit beta